MIKALKYLIPCIALLGIVAGIYGVVHYYKKVTRLENNLAQSTVEYKTLSGKLATATTQLSVTKSELKQALKKDSLHRSAYERQLYDAAKLIKDLKLRPATVETVTNIVTVSNDSGLVSKDSIIKFPLIISRPHYVIKLFRRGDSILHNHQYWNSLSVVVSLERYFKSGNRIKHPKWYFWKSWVPVTTVVSADSSASVSIPVSVKLRQ